jgi:hypothetical protein
MPPAMHDWRSRAWYQIGLLEAALGPGAAGDVELARRRDMWGAIERFSWPQFKEPQFGQLELSTRTEAELLRYMAASPPMREAALGEGAKTAAAELPEPVAGFPDWGSRALFQIKALAEVLGDPEDPEVGRRAGMWQAIAKHAWPQFKEQQFAQVELVTRVEVELLKYMMQSPPMREMLEKHRAKAEEQNDDGGTGNREQGTEDREQGTEERPKEKEPEPVAMAAFDADIDPLGDIAPVQKYSGPPASVLYKEGQAAWAEYAANEYKSKSKAREAARKIREVVLLLEKNPDGETQLKALEKVIGLTWQEIADNVLERRVR